MKYIQYLVLISGLILSSGVQTSMADISFLPVTWSTPGNAEGWTSLNAVGTVAESGGALNMNFAAAGPGPVQLDAMVANNVEGFNGNYGAYANLSVSFNFQGYLSSAQSLYFVSTVGTGSTWAYDLNVPDSGLHNYSFSLSDPTGWTEVIGTESFSSALTMVNLIGITVQHVTTGSPFNYYLDDWQYGSGSPVPEPGSIALLFSALGSIGMAYRSRRKKSQSVPNQA